MINSLRANTQLQQVSYDSQKSYTTRQQTQPAANQDKVSISKTGKLISGFFADMGVAYTPGKSVSLDDIETGLQQKRQNLNSDITAMFLENGINTPPEVQLTSDEEGHVRVSGNHPQAEQIEQLFADNADLENDFKRVSAMSSMVEAGHTHTEFAKQYKKNPYAAVAQFGEQLFGQNNNDAFIMTVGASSTLSSQADQTNLQGQPENSADVKATQVEETAIPKNSTATNESTPDKADESSTINFSDATRKELLDWMNGEVRGGRMSLDESFPLMSMTLKISATTGQSMSMETDQTRINFEEKARLGLEAANARNDLETAKQLRIALNIMAKNQSKDVA
ncbi:hypothetical protein [Maridesulfovibrio sp.]|uniref:hypothetical protein n=1 Tax=Maridesulfovibrio sp. TaxID=2795000 RepID=UPI0029C9C972|nr:hypothetical protein [Maridesulfovibrio sp.]